MKRNDSGKHTITPEEFREMNSEERIMKMAEQFGTPQGKPEEGVLEAIFKPKEVKKPAKTIRFYLYTRATAAVILLLAGIYTITVVFSKETVRTHFGEQAELRLPDGTKVVLNAGSKITWSDKNFKNSRELKLKGEAYFDVEKGDEFIIETKNGTVEILGTQLNVFSRENNFRVSCISGKVKVTSGADEQIITPGEMAELTGNGLLKNSKNNPYFPDDPECLLQLVIPFPDRNN